MKEINNQTKKCESYTPHKETYYKGLCLCYVNTGKRGWCKMLQLECDGKGNMKPETQDARPLFQHGIEDSLFYREV